MYVWVCSPPEQVHEERDAEEAVGAATVHVGAQVGALSLEHLLDHLLLGRMQSLGARSAHTSD